jgi:hypothetical protein
MKGMFIATIAIASFGAMMEYAVHLDRKFAVHHLIQAAKDERARTHYIYEDVDLGDAPFIPHSARVRDMAKREAW